MSDLFHEDVPDDYIEAVAQVMLQANWHTYQVLTRRAERVRQLLDGRLKFAARQSRRWHKYRHLDGLAVASSQWRENDETPLTRART